MNQLDVRNCLFSNFKCLKQMWKPKILIVNKRFTSSKYFFKIRSNLIKHEKKKSKSPRPGDDVILPHRHLVCPVGVNKGQCTFPYTLYRCHSNVKSLHDLFYF